MAEPTTSPACVYCGSPRSAEILYGRIAQAEELRADLDAGKVVLGGCIVSEDMPTHRCLDCGKEWKYTPPAPDLGISERSLPVRAGTAKKDR